MSRYLVTGGRGFLGGSVDLRLRDAGHEVVVLSRGVGDKPDVTGHGSEIRYGDIRDPAAVEEAARDVDVVIHLASDFRDLGVSLEESREVNVGGTLNVLEAAVTHDLERVVHCSTIGVYGSLDEVPADEQTPLDPPDIPYEITKAEAEEELWEFYRRTGFPVTVVRPSSIYGAGDLRLLKLFRMIDAGRLIMFGSGEVYIDQVYVDDVAQGLHLAATHEDAPGEAFHIAGGEYVTLSEFVRTIAEKLDAPGPRVRIPLAPVIALATVAEKLCEPFGITPPLTRRRLGFFSNNRAYSIEKAREMLGYEPRYSLDEGLEATIHWYRERGYL